VSREPLTLIERARAYVNRAEPAVSGQGGHAATMKVARTLVSGFGLNPDDALGLLREFNVRCVPQWSDRELAHKVRSALLTPSPHPPGWMLDSGRTSNAALPPIPKEWPRPSPWNRQAIDQLADDLVITPRWLAQRSPVDPAQITADMFLRHVFEGGQQALVFTKQQSQGQALWPKEAPPRSGPEGVWFLIQPVDGLFHKNPRQGKESRRSEESVTQWRHMLLESDEAPRGPWLAAIARLPLPIVSIATSGNVSLHVLIRLDAETKDEWEEARREMLAPLSLLGCDAAAMTAVRLARLPGCHRRDRKALQKLFYLNPDPEPVALAES